MLVVARKKDGKLTIDNEIEIQVLRINGNSVRLGIKAPAHIPIHRSEASEPVKKKAASASQTRGKKIAEG